MPTPPTVAEFLAALEHPDKPAILALRALILAADPRIAESIKWQAPSFYTTAHFATFHLRAKVGVQLILHLDAKKRLVPPGLREMADPRGLLTWLAEDRATVVLHDVADVAEKAEALTTVVRQWVAWL